MIETNFSDSLLKEILRILAENCIKGYIFDNSVVHHDKNLAIKIMDSTIFVCTIFCHATSTIFLERVVFKISLADPNCFNSLAGFVGKYGE